METILEVVEEGNDDVEEEMVDDELQSRNEMIDDVSVESCVDNAETLPPNVQYSGVQYVGDNIDLNIVSINGNTAFHAMGMIKVSSKSSSMTNEYLNSKMSRLRLKPSDRAKILRAGDTPIKLCGDPKKSDIDSIKFEPLSDLLHDFAPTPAELNPADIIWAAGWIIKKPDDKFSHANWNGWMKNVHNSDEKSPSSIVYQPIIDSNPNDYSTINTSLLRGIQLEKPNYAVITFDLPIWLKAVDLILSQRMPIIPRLGGFHLLKSYLATFGALFADSGLHDIIKLIYEGGTAADNILNGNSYDKAIRAHFLIDVAILQHVVPISIFTDNEMSLMKPIILDCSKNHAGIGSKDIPMAERFRSKNKNVLAQLDNTGRTPSLWCLYHYMVDTIKIIICAERMGDFTLHLSCITNRMLHVFAAAGHHNYAKAALLYVQMMKTHEKGSAEEIAIINSFKENGNHVVTYSSNEWSGVWSDLTIEQTLMKNSKSEGGISGGRFHNAESAQKVWVQTLDHMSLINQLSTKKTCKVIHRDLANAQRLADEKVINAISNWFDDMQPFNEQTPKEFLVSFSTGFISRKGDGVNPEETIDVGNTIQKKLDGKVLSTTVERKSKVKSLANLRKLVSGSDGTAPINALKYFNRLALFAQSEDNLESSLGFDELTPIPISLFSEKDQLMHEGDKATFAKFCLKDKTDLTDKSQDTDIDTVVIDGGWLLR